MAQPPFKWFGSKATLAPRIVSLLPPHRHYVEVFAGSAAVLFAKPRSEMETVNDLDGEIVNLFRVLRDEALTSCLIRHVALTPYSRAEFNLARLDEPSDEPVERARRFLVRCWQAVGNEGQGWSLVVKADTLHAARLHRWTALPERLAASAARLAGVQVDQRDWREMITRFDTPGACLFVDPPYHADTRPGAAVKYRHEFDHADHLQLAAALAGVRHASVVLTHYPHPLYDNLGWDHVDIAAHADNASAGGLVTRTERLYLRGTSEPQQSLFADHPEPSLA